MLTNIGHARFKLALVFPTRHDGREGQHRPGKVKPAGDQGNAAQGHIDDLADAPGLVFLASLALVEKDFDATNLANARATVLGWRTGFFAIRTWLDVTHDGRLTRK